MEQISLILKEKNLIASPVYDLEPSNWQVTHVHALSSRRQFRFPLALELVLILMVLVLLFSSPLTPPQMLDAKSKRRPLRGRHENLKLKSTCVSFDSESEVAQSCPTLSDPMDCSLPGSSVHGIFQARILEWVAISFSMCVV